MRLAVFFGAVAADPSQFPLTGTMAEALKRGARKAKGPAQPTSRRNPRKDRQEKRQGFQRRRRAEKRDLVAQHNAVQEAMAAERVEMDEAYAEMRTRLEAEPKVNVTDAAGNVILAGVPQSMIHPVEPESAEYVLTSDGSIITEDGRNIGNVATGERPQIILPNSVEARG